MTELYVSALHLDRKAVKALKITDPYSLHRVVYSLFSDVRTDAEKHSHIQSGIVYADKAGEYDGYQPSPQGSDDFRPATNSTGQRRSGQPARRGDLQITGGRISQP